MNVVTKAIQPKLVENSNSRIEKAELWDVATKFNLSCEPDLSLDWLWLLARLPPIFDHPFPSRTSFWASPQPFQSIFISLAGGLDGSSALSKSASSSSIEIRFVCEYICAPNVYFSSFVRAAPSDSLNPRVGSRTPAYLPANLFTGVTFKKFSTSDRISGLW